MCPHFTVDAKCTLAHINPPKPLWPHFVYTFICSVIHCIHLHFDLIYSVKWITHDIIFVLSDLFSFSYICFHFMRKIKMTNETLNFFLLVSHRGLDLISE